MPSDGVTIGNQAYDLGLTRKYKWAGNGAVAESTNLPALGNTLEGLEMKEGEDFPQGDKMLRKEDHQAFVRGLDQLHRVLAAAEARLLDAEFYGIHRLQNPMLAALDFEDELTAS
jgi:hypothetical protein